jgi:uncharacterized Zn finger protein
VSYWGFKPYVSAAERRQRTEKAAAKARKAGAQFSPIAPYRGPIARTFWGKAWCENLEHYSDFANRLPRGRTYARNGSVIDLKIDAGAVRAQVMGSRLYSVGVTVEAVPEKQWRAISADCAASIDSLVELLQGKLSRAVMERICKPGIGLFPAPRDIKFNCSCPDWASMCKHVAAVLYGVGTRLDHQPELLFSLRRVDARQLVAQAGAGLPTARKGLAIGRMLDDNALADVFGIEMAEVSPSRRPATPPPKVRTPPGKTKTLQAPRTLTMRQEQATATKRSMPPATITKAIAGKETTDSASAKPKKLRATNVPVKKAMKTTGRNKSSPGSRKLPGESASRKAALPASQAPMRRSPRPRSGTGTA